MSGRAASLNATDFTDLVEQHRAQALSVAIAILHNADLAHDVVADALMLAWIHRTQFNRDGPLEAWFIRIVRNRAFECRRRLRSRAVHESDAELPLWQLDSGPNVERAMIARERNAQVRSVVRRIPPLLRAPIRLFYWEGLGYPEAAERLEISRAAFNTRLTRSKKMFREKWLGVS
jgi:RNA polymerase sigma factor (sigma-70 family)